MTGKLKLDARTLRWVADRARDGRIRLPFTESERVFNQCLQYIASKCRDEARALERKPKAGKK